MQLMTALVRVAGNPLMTVRRNNITPAEALVLQHIHDADTKDVFESAKLTGTVERSNTEERARLKARYPEHVKLVDMLFPGINAADIPQNFADLPPSPLEVQDMAPEPVTASAPAPAHKARTRAKAAPRTLADDTNVAQQILGQTPALAGD